MAEHSMNIAPDGSVSYVPAHDLVEGACGWSGRHLSLDEEVANSLGQLGLDVRYHEGYNYAVTFCQFAAGEVHVVSEPPSVDTRAPDGE